MSNNHQNRYSLGIFINFSSELWTDKAYKDANQFIHLAWYHNRVKDEFFKNEIGAAMSNLKIADLFLSI